MKDLFGRLLNELLASGIDDLVPFVFHGGVVLTDARIMIRFTDAGLASGTTRLVSGRPGDKSDWRVEPCDSCRQLWRPPGFSPGSIDRLLDAAGSPAVEMPVIPGPPEGHDTWVLPDMECSQCDGEGSLRCSLEHEHECTNCDGEGRCGGIPESAFEAIEVGGHPFGRRYLWLVQSCRPARVMVKRRGDGGILHWTFAGGSGALMGTRDRT